MRPENIDELLARNRELEARLDEAEEALRAIRSGEVDAIVVAGPDGDAVYTLKGADEGYRLLIEQMAEGAVTLAADGVILFANDQLARMLRLPLERVIGSHIHDFTAPAGRRILAALLSARDASKSELELKRGDGELVSVYVAANRLQFDGLACTTLVITDLTAQRRNEEIVAAGKLARSILEQAAAAILVLDPEGRIIQANQAAEKLAGGSVLLRSFSSAFRLSSGPEAKDLAFKEIRAAVHRDGAIRGLQAIAHLQSDRTAPVLVSAGRLTTLDSEPLGYVITLYDISDLKQAEEALRGSEERFRALVTATSDVVYRMSPDWSEMWQMYGQGFLAGTEEPIRTWLEQFIFPEDQAYVKAAIDEAIRSKTKFELEHRVLRADGTVGWTFSRAIPILDSGGKIIEWFGAATDVSRRKEAESNLREAQERERARAAELQAILEAAPVAMFVSQDPECRTMIGNKMTYEMLRLNPGANVSQTVSGEAPATFRAMRNGQEIPALELPAQKAALTGKPVRNYEFDVVYQDGTCRNMLGDAVPLPGEDGKPRGAVGAFVDISERKRTEERLRQTQKLESIGLLAGGIAHDFNNLLTGVMGNASLLLEEAPSEWTQALRSIIAATERAAHLTRQLLAYSGKGQFIVRELDITQAVNETADLVQFSIPKSVSLALNLERRLPLVEMDPGQLQQILMNLVINAGEAIGDGNPGRITVTTSMCDITAPFTDELGMEVVAGRYVCVEVSDSGCGIPQERKARIFDPFFTTKFVGRGLGLAAVAGVLRAQKGGITVESKAGEGSVFRVFLPIAGRGAAEVQEPPPGDRRASILVVDDEVSVRDFIGSVLRKKGYHVIQASDGREALALCGAAPGAVSAAIVDIIMPNMAANELLPALKAKQPDVRILLTSGYSEAEVRRLCAAYPGAAFIQKPYTVQQLVKAVSDLLAEAV